MKPDTRLLIRLSFEDGSQKGWGYDYPHYKTSQHLREAIEKDFNELPTNTEIHLFYYKSDGVITAHNATELADNSIIWLNGTGNYYGN